MAASSASSSFSPVGRAALEVEGFGMACKQIRQFVQNPGVLHEEYILYETDVTKVACKHPTNTDFHHKKRKERKRIKKRKRYNFHHNRHSGNQVNLNVTQMQS